MIADIVARVTASATPCAARFLRRKAAIWRLNLMTSAPYKPCHQPRRGVGKGTYTKDTNEYESR